jgi:hypothetical protein
MLDCLIGVEVGKETNEDEETQGKQQSIGVII